MKSLTLASLITFLSLVSKAQIGYGGLVGWNHVDASAHEKNGTTIPVESGNGFHLGMMLKVPFDRKLYFLPQLLYSYKSYSPQFDNVYGDSVLESEYHIHYLEFPLLLEYETVEGRPHVFFQFGPSFSLALSGKQKLYMLDQTTHSEKMVFDFYAYDHFEFNLVGKIGYQFSNNMIASVGYALGLGSIVDDDNGPVIKPRTITVSIGYWFR